MTRFGVSVAILCVYLCAVPALACGTPQVLSGGWWVHGLNPHGNLAGCCTSASDPSNWLSTCASNGVKSAVCCLGYDAGLTTCGAALTTTTSTTTSTTSE